MRMEINIDEYDYEKVKELVSDGVFDYEGTTAHLYKSVANSAPLTPDTLADLLMKERIRGDLKQDVTYSKDIIDGVRCKLTVEIIDRRPCHCGAELKEDWREKSEVEE